MARAPVFRDPRWGDAAALILLSVGGAAAWWGALGSGLLWLAPVIAVAALAAGGVLGVRAAVIVAAAWPPGAILAAGLPAGALAPAAWDTTVASLRAGVEALPTIDTGTPVIQSWALAAVLLVAGTGTSIAGILWRGDGWERSLLGFARVLVPLGAAVAMQQTSDAPWQGAIVLVAVVLRVARGRLVPILATASLVGAVALFGAQVAAPRAGWQVSFDHPHHLSQFHELDTNQTYGPLDDRRTGAVMLDITTRQPALWRMQVLEAFDNRRWLAAHENSHLPEPAARPHSIRVEVRGLHNRLIVTPGRILSVHAPVGLAVGGRGPGAPRHPERRRHLSRRGRDGRRRGGPPGADPAAHRAALPDAHADRPRAAAALRPLSALEARAGHAATPRRHRLGPALPPLLPPVARGRHRACRGPVGRELPAEGRPLPLHHRRRHPRHLEPLMEFLFHTHQGYCQHFAGAAALLLRVAGVPTRVVCRLRHRRRDQPRLGRPRQGRPRLDRGLLPGRRLGPLQPDSDRRSGRRLPRPRPPAGKRRLPGRGGWEHRPAGGRRRRVPRPPPRRRPPGAAPPAAHAARRAPGPPRAGALGQPDNPAEPLPDLDRDRPRHRRPGAGGRARPLRRGGAGRPSHPGLTVWCALVADVGPWRSLGLMLRAATTVHPT